MLPKIPKTSTNKEERKHQKQKIGDLRKRNLIEVMGKDIRWINVKGDRSRIEAPASMVELLTTGVTKIQEVTWASMIKGGL